MKNNMFSKFVMVLIVCLALTAVYPAFVQINEADAGVGNCPDDVNAQTPQSGKACVFHNGHWQEVSCNSALLDDPANTVGATNCEVEVPAATPAPTTVPATKVPEPTVIGTPPTTPIVIVTPEPEETEEVPSDDGDGDKTDNGGTGAAAAAEPCSDIECACVQLVLDWMEKFALPLAERFLDNQEDANAIQQERNDILANQPAPVVNVYPSQEQKQFQALSSSVEVTVGTSGAEIEDKSVAPAPKERSKVGGGRLDIEHDDSPDLVFWVVLILAFIGVWAIAGWIWFMMLSPICIPLIGYALYRAFRIDMPNSSASRRII